jgi:membrane-bound lytic murein transglycosylase D
MPELASPLVAEKERFYLARPDYLQRMFARGGRYLYFIVEEIEKRGMPTELALLPFVESAMNPVALSPAQAAGLWQFIPSTGRAYDLRQDWWVDNRRDVVQSTRAALDYLQRIYAMHGNDWFLALASYNWGEGAVARAVRRNQAAGRPGDYLSLAMPNETRHYVPKLMALRNLVLNAERIGVALPALPNRPYFVAIEKTRPIDLDLAARFAGMSVEEFVALNPAHNRPVISATRNNQIKIPADRAERFRAELERHEAQSKAFATWEPYTLKPGETLDELARARGVSVADLRKANGLREGSRIMSGTHLLAPAGAKVDEERIERFVAPRIYEQVERPARYHTVGKRDSLASIASRYKVPVASLAAWNGLNDSAPRGARLVVQPAGTQTLLTTEDGERSVLAAPRPAVATAATAVRPSPAAAPRAAPSRPARKVPTATNAAKPPPTREAARGRPAPRPDTPPRARLASRT